jgi:hypothetical protein
MDYKTVNFVCEDRTSKATLTAENSGKSGLVFIR